MRTGLLVADLNLMLYHIVIFVSLLLLEAHTCDFVGKYDCASVKNGNLRGIHLDQTVVDACGIEGCQSVLDSRYFGIALGDYSATACLDYILCQSIDDGLVRKVYALEFISVILGCRIECSLYFKACVKSFTFYGEFTAKSLLLHSDRYYL